MEPFDTYCGMKHLLGRENWPPANRVEHVAYFCAVLKEDTWPNQTTADEQAYDNAKAFVTNDFSRMFSNGNVAGPLDMNDLVAYDGQAVGWDRLRAQHFTANVFNSTRYVATHHDTVAARLWPDESGYGNLFLAEIGPRTASTVDAWRRPSCPACKRPRLWRTTPARST